MPNHIQNRIEIVGDPERVRACIEQYTTHVPERDNMTHDEGQHICYVEGTERLAGWYDAAKDEFQAAEDRWTDVRSKGLPHGVVKGRLSAYDLFDFEKVIPPPDDPAYGATCTGAMRDNPRNWYNWNIDNWGTKWNSYCNKREGSNVLLFETAWSMPLPIARAMQEAWPDLDIRWAWADEDFGVNCGMLDRRTVFRFKYESEDDNTLGYCIAAVLRPDQAADYVVMPDGTIDYDDEETGKGGLREFVKTYEWPDIVPDWFQRLARREA